MEKTYKMRNAQELKSFLEENGLVVSDDEASKTFQRLSDDDLKFVSGGLTAEEMLEIIRKLKK